VIEGEEEEEMKEVLAPLLLAHLGR